MMYNDNIKTDYINSLKTENDINKIRIIFERISTLEKQLDKDLYDISYDDALENLSEVSNYTSLDTIRSVYSAIKKYKLWALSKGYMSGDEKPFIVDRSAAKRFYEKHQCIEVFRNPSELVNRLSPLLDVHSNVGIVKSEIIAAYLMLCYQGFYPDEVLQLTLDNVKVTQSNILFFNDRYSCIIYKEFEDIINKICTIREVLVSTKFKKTTEHMGDNIISFSNKYSFEKNKKTIRQRMWHILSETNNIIIKPELITIMGIIYMAKTRGLLDDINNDSKYGYNVKQLLNACYGTTDVKVYTRNNTMKIYELW